MRPVSETRVLLVAVALLLSAGPPTAATAQQRVDGAGRWEAATRRDAAVSLGGRAAKSAAPNAPAPRPAPTATVTESEPNDSYSAADAAAVGDTIGGVVGVASDVDYYAIPLTAGQTVDFDVDAQVNGSALDAYLVLFGTDGFSVVAANDDFDGLDSRIRYAAGATGTYYLAIDDYAFGGSASHTYSIRVDELPPAPGDPTTTRASGADAAWSVIAGSAGELYVLDWLDGDVWQVPPTGAPSKLASTTGYDMVLDAFGDLLVTQPENENVVRVSTSTGAVTNFVATPGRSPVSLAVGPDGDVWIFAAGLEDARLFRYSAYGALREEIDASSYFALKMAFSPAGDLHMSDGMYEIYRLETGGSFELVFGSEYGVGGLSFDEDGNIYVSTPASGLLRLNPEYEVTDDPFARANLGLSGNTAFVRSATGAMTTRLVATDLNTGNLIEMDPASISVAGFRVGTDLERLTISNDDAARHLLEEIPLEADMAAYLDGQGNGNGEFDVGDLRALVRSQPSSTESND